MRSFFEPRFCEVYLRRFVLNLDEVRVIEDERNVNLLLLGHGGLISTCPKFLRKRFNVTLHGGCCSELHKLPVVFTSLPDRGKVMCECVINCSLLEK